MFIGYPVNMQSQKIKTYQIGVGFSEETIVFIIVVSLCLLLTETVTDIKQTDNIGEKLLLANDPHESHLSEIFLPFEENTPQPNKLSSMKPIFPLLKKTACLMHCFNIILNSTISKDSYVVLVNSDLDLDVPHIRLDYRKSISTYNLFRRKFNFYLIDCSTVPFKNFTDSFSTQPFFSSDSRFLFFCEDLKDETLLSLRRFVILNMIYLNTTTGDILTYFPYEKRTFQQFDISLEVVGHCGGNRKQHLSQLFPHKIPKKWSNTTLNIFHSFAPPYCIGSEGELGIELDMQILILDRLGMKPNFTKMYIPQVGKRKMIVDVLKGVYCDYMIGVSSPAPYFEFTVPYIYDDLIWYVPNSKAVSKWKYLFEILSKLVWICWVISSMTAIVSLYIIDIFLYGEWRPTNFLQKFMIFYRLFLEQSLNFRTRYISEMILMAMFIFLTLMMNLIYKSKFFYFLTSTRYEDDMNSIQDVMDTGMTIGFLKWHNVMFEDNKQLVLYLRNHYQSCNMEANCSDQAAFSRNLAVLRPKIKMIYWTNRYLDKNGRPLLKPLKYSVSDLFWVAAFFPGHPLFPSINQYIHYLLDFGIMNEILSKYSGGVNKGKNNPKTHRLTINHVKVPFVIWAFATLIGLMIFVCEMKLFYKNNEPFRKTSS